MNKVAKGRIGENLACDYLTKEGFYIIKRNFQSRFGEIDAVALDRDRTLVFVEIKTRSSDIFGSPAAAVTKEKMRHFIMAAKIFVAMNKNYEKNKIRFDVIEVFLNEERHSLNHLKNVSM